MGATQTTTEYAVLADGVEAIYTADDGETGTDTFAWVAGDGRDDSETATVTVQLDPAPPAPEPEPEPDPGDTGDEITEDTGGDEPSENDDEVLGDAPEVDPAPAPACGASGTAQTLALSVFCGILTLWGPFRPRRCGAAVL